MFDVSKMSPKWDNEKWVIDQFTSHIAEVEELFNSRDEHLMAEVVDLLVIARRLIEIDNSNKALVMPYINLWLGMSASNISQDLVNARYRKFKEKADLDIDPADYPAFSEEYCHLLWEA